jgi:hypothetical protein
VAAFYFAAWVIDASLGGGLHHAAPGAQAQLPIPRASDEEMAAAAAEVQAMRRAPSPAVERRIDELFYQLYRLDGAAIDPIERAAR